MSTELWKGKKCPCGLPISFTWYRLSDDRLFIDTGFFSKQQDEVRLYRILDISLRRSLWQRICGIGTISINSSDKTLGNFQLVDIKNSTEVKEMLSEAVEAQRTSKRVSSREFMGEFDGEDIDA